MTCSRVLIMNGGKILAADSPENLQRLMSDGGQVVAEIAAPIADLRTCWEQVPEVEHYDISAAEGDYFRCALTPRLGIDLRPQVFELAMANGWKLRELSRARHSLEDIYMRVTRPENDEEVF